MSEIKLPERNSFILGDCMDYLPLFPDKYFDLAIVDPPYGIGFSDYERGSLGEFVRRRYTKDEKKKWDYRLPDKDYFDQLFRISKNSIIWGGNYFNLPSCKHFIFWYKKNPVPNFSDGEFAWTTFDKPSKCFEYPYYGNINSEPDRIHPTQKPVALYRWLLKNYAKKGDLILDTHVGSASSLIACVELGFDYIGFEKDEEYYEKASKRLKSATRKYELFE
jgi:site-specific DNA-methyltransferase (adenine-specific)